MSEPGPSGRRGSVRRAIAVPGDWAVWAGLYATGVLGLLSWLGDQRPPPVGWLFVFLCAQAGYLFDRVKISRSRMDPADAVAQPDRFLALLRHHRAVRTLIVVELLCASAVGWWIWSPLALVPAGVAAVIDWYAGRPADPTRPRPKDRAAAKGLFITAGHICLAIGPLVSARAGPLWGRLAAGAMVVALVIFADAVLCDLDDRHADAGYGTMSIPVLAGPRAAWLTAGAAYAFAAVAAFLVVPPVQATCFAALLLASAVVARLLPRRRDFIDARLAVIAAACLALA